MYRSWKNHLRSCKPENQVEMYQTLCILIDEYNLSSFNKILDQFIEFWSNKEPDFISYFKQQFQSRPGEH